MLAIQPRPTSTPCARPQPKTLIWKGTRAIEWLARFNVGVKIGDSVDGVPSHVVAIERWHKGRWGRYATNLNHGNSLIPALLKSLLVEKNSLIVAYRVSITFDMELGFLIIFTVGIESSHSICFHHGHWCRRIVVLTGQWVICVCRRRFG